MWRPISRACRIEELGSDLADIALDISDETSLRKTCAAAVADIGSAKIRSRLRPLAFGQAGDDPDDEFKGCGLKALWPEFIAMAEILPLITAPKQMNLSGLYSRFLDDDFLQKVDTKDLPAALDWFSNQGIDASVSVSLIV